LWFGGGGRGLRVLFDALRLDLQKRQNGIFKLFDSDVHGRVHFQVDLKKFLGGTTFCQGGEARIGPRTEMYNGLCGE